LAICHNRHHECSYVEFDREADLSKGPGADAFNVQRQTLWGEMARKAAQQPAAIEPNGA
jgi:hypothetical protein